MHDCRDCCCSSTVLVGGRTVRCHRPRTHKVHSAMIATDDNSRAWIEWRDVPAWEAEETTARLLAERDTATDPKG